MGVSNLSLLLSALGCKETNHLDPSFDCILVDLQSTIYSYLSTSNKALEPDILDEICDNVFNYIISLLQWLFEYNKPALTVMIAFDGKGVPMKWPLQSKRRSAALDDTINIIRAAIFECNTISQRVYTYLENRIEQGDLTWFQYCPSTPSRITFVLSSSEIPGEGEHKLFKFAKTYAFKRPLVVSVDNDVFLIAMSRSLSSVQVIKKVNMTPKIYHLNAITTDARILFYSSFLFGNDFIPEIVKINEGNATAIAEILQQPIDSHVLPVVIYTVVQELVAHKKIRYLRLDYFQDVLLIEYWKNCLWICDYYTQDSFPQLYMENRFFEIFDRNQLLTAFESLTTMKQTFMEARNQYAKLVTQPPLEPCIFSEEQIEILKPYLLPTPSQAYLSCVQWTL